MTDPLAKPPVSAIRTTWAIVRLVCATVLAAAIITQVFATVNWAEGEGFDLLTAVTNHLSTFTVISSVFGAIVLALGGVWLVRHQRPGTMEPRWLTVIFLCVGVAMVITGIVYNLLLRASGPDPDTVRWASEIKHSVAPIVFALDLALCVACPAMRWRDVGLALIFPLVWITYTLIRGPFITSPATGEPWWYPYGFLNPHTTGWGVALYIVGIAVALAALAALAVWRSQWGAKRRAAG